MVRSVCVFLFNHSFSSFLLCHRIVYPNQAKSGLGNTPFSLISNSYTSFLFPIMHFISSACQIVHYIRWCMLSMDPYTPAVSSLRPHSIDVLCFSHYCSMPCSMCPVRWNAWWPDGLYFSWTGFWRIKGEGIQFIEFDLFGFALPRGINDMCWTVAIHFIRPCWVINETWEAYKLFLNVELHPLEYSVGLRDNLHNTPLHSAGVNNVKNKPQHQPPLLSTRQGPTNRQRNHHATISPP